MKMNKSVWIIGVVLIVVILVVVIVSLYGSQEAFVRIGGDKDIDIQTPHPYPNSTSERSLVWSYKLNHPDATFLKLHFNTFEVVAEINTPVIYESIYIPCPDPSVGELQEGVTSVDELAVCGNKTIKKSFTPEEILSNNYISGDYILIRDANHNILDLLTQAPTNGWSRTYDGQEILNIELYADNSENGYGLMIDKYSYGFPREWFFDFFP